MSRVVSDSAAQNLCFAIIDFLAQESEANLESLSFLRLSKIAGKQAADAELLRALAILVGTRVRALESHFYFIDEDEAEYQVDKTAVSEARRSGVFIHPHKGDPVENFEDHLVMYFSPTQRVLDLKRGSE